jgi:hypothetical protein
MDISTKNATKIEVTGATLDFYEFNEDDTTYYFFDSSLTGPPEPMVNAMAGLRLLDSANKKLLMLNHKAPNGLFPKISEHFGFEIQELDNGNTLVTFSYKDESASADLSQTHCDG